jgi:hypothetical protein
MTNQVQRPDEHRHAIFRQMTTHLEAGSSKVHLHAARPSADEQQPWQFVQQVHMLCQFETCQKMPTLQVRPGLQVGSGMSGGGNPPHGPPMPDCGLGVHTPGASAIRGSDCSAQRVDISAIVPVDRLLLVPWTLLAELELCCRQLQWCSVIRDVHGRYSARLSKAHTPCSTSRWRRRG